MYDKCVALLNERGVAMSDIVDCVLFLQKQYILNLREEEAESAVESVISKREVQHAILVAIELDKQAEKNTMIDKQLTEIISKDAGLFGIDEVLAYGICNLYGSIALTNYGYIDKVKPGIIAKLNDHNQEMCHTFLDDIVGAIAASAASKIAHTN